MTGFCSSYTDNDELSLLYEAPAFGRLGKEMEASLGYITKTLSWNKNKKKKKRKEGNKGRIGKEQE